MKKRFFGLLLVLMLAIFMSSLIACNNVATIELIYIVDNEVYLSFEMIDGVDNIENPSVPNKTGYEGFWCEEQTIDGVKKIIATYTPIEYNVTYENTYNAENNNKSSFTIADENIELKAISRAGYVFNGWFKDELCSTKITEIDTKEATDISVYASWSAIEYNVTYENTYNAENDNKSSFTIADENIELKAISRAGYVFNGWFKEESCLTEITEIDTRVLDNMSIYANWSIDKNAYGDLPLILIETQNSVLPYDKETYINCSFSLSNCSNEKYNFNVEMKEAYGDTDSVGIRLRGNSTRYFEKKPYRIKFDKKKSLLGLEKNKSWVLLADYMDNSSIRNYTAFSLGKKMDSLDFTPSPNHVVLYLNGEYKGLYLLVEQIDEKEGRTNVEADIAPMTQTEFPFLIEMDRNALYEGVTGIDNFKLDYYYPMEIKYPEHDERGLDEGEEDVVFNYIREYMNAVFYTLNTNEKVTVSFRENPVSFADLVDVDSFIEYWLVNEIMRNQDSTWGSIYMHKTVEGKLEFGPVWDFDWSLSSSYLGKPYDKSEIDTARSYCILSALTPLKSFVQNQENYNLVCQKWDEIKSNILEVVEDLYDYKWYIKDEAIYDANFWYGEKGGLVFDLQFDYVRLYLLERYNFIDETLTEDNYESFIEN